MAKRRVTLRGRWIVAIVLAAFVFVAVGVVWRRTLGVAGAHELDALGQERRQLEAERGSLVADIREAASRSRIAPIAERRLEMRIPNDSQLVFLPRQENEP
ncbi:MAG: cell division protein FtsL [Gemmatimonadota bacterium]|nr:cell division protein FtsL [Gemmatimonadota bacterium]